MLAPTFKLTEDFPPVAYDAWRAMVEAELQGAPFDKKLTTRLYEGITLQPLYTEQDWPQTGDPSGFPGAAPFTRGAEPLRRAWQICQAYGQPDPAAANAEILADLENGTTALALRLAAATRAGLDGDAPEAADLAAGEGVLIGALADLDRALAGVDTVAAPVALEPGAAFLPAAALLAALWRRQGARPMAGCFGADPLGALAADGRVAGSVEGALGQLGALAVWTQKHLPGVTAAEVATTPYHDAGATAVQELALALATGVAYLRAMTAAGLDVDAAARQIRFRISAGTQFFQEIAKLRAARKLWARVVEACGGGEAARAMRMHVETARRSMTQRDPWVNMLRATVACFAGAVAGAESIGVEPFDARLGLPDAMGRRVARNTQIVLAEESNLARVIDPAGGCWFLEKLTDQFAEAAWKMFQEIEAAGGAAQAITSGWVAGQIDAKWGERLKALVKRKDAVTGVSEFPNIGEKLPERAQPAVAAVAKAAAPALAAARANAEARSALASLAAVAGVEQVEMLVTAASAGATVGQMSEALGAATVQAATPLPERYLAEPFETLRDASDAHLAKTGARPKVFLVNLGPVAHHTARATYSQNFFEAGGFEVIGSAGFKEADAAAAGWKASGAPIAVICSSDKIYADQVAPTAQALKAAGAPTVILAGNPGENREAWSAAGVDDYIHLGCDVHGMLSKLLKQEGVLA